MAFVATGFVLRALGGALATHVPPSGWFLASCLLWALREPDGWMRGWHLVSVLPLGAALVRFDRLTGLADDRPVEDLIARDPMMMCTEATWLTLFLVGL